jgi:6-pyruvoyltetrahydropterin/6-carboxytetrahydropterin synthase
VTFEVEGELDSLGRVADFSVIKQLLAMWLEDNWDHKFILWEQDPAVPAMQAIDSTLVVTPFNPTAENLAQFILEVVGPAQLAGTGVTLVKVTVEETRKCSATARLG